MYLKMGEDYRIKSSQKNFKKVIDGDISDAEAFARIANYISITTENNEQFVRDITLLLVGVEEILSITQYKKLKELYALQQINTSGE